tara:strand:- start:281 stop:613 length:333 start_codon:yes stop_codon:yes gene_type:complete
MILLSLLLAFTPLPSRSTIDGECPRALPLIAGQHPPEDLVEPDTFTISCGAVAVPSSQVVYFLSVEAWSAGAHEELEALEAVVVPASPLPWLQGAAIGFGAGLALALVLQ